MRRALNLYQSTVGKKAVVAVTGIVLLGYVIGHLLGNLQIYLGPDAFNSYAAYLKSKPALLWGVRMFLLVSVIAHIIATFQLWRKSQAARTTAYRHREDVVTNYAAKTMRLSGPVLLLFIAYHLAHLTLGVVDKAAFSPTDVYANVIRGFRNIYVSSFYILAMLALGLHLYHGIWSVFQSLGLNHPRYNQWRKRLAVGLTAFLVAGYVSIPLAVLLGWIA